MDSRLQIVAIFGAVALLLLVLELVRRRALMERYALLWLFATAVMLGLSIWRDLLERFADVVGVAYPPSALFVIAFGFILVILLHFSLVISRLADQNKVLAQRLGQLQQRVDQLSAAGAQTEDNAEPRIERLRARFGAELPTTDEEFWPLVGRESVRLAEPQLPKAAVPAAQGWTRDDIAWQAQWSGPDGEGWAVAFRGKRPMAVQGAAAAGDTVWATLDGVTDLTDDEAETAYLRRTCVPVATAIGSATYDEQAAIKDAVDVAFTAHDHGTERGVEQDYARALPIAEALHDAQVGDSVTLPKAELEVVAIVDVDRVPISDDARAIARDEGASASALDHALSDGEDFEPYLRHYRHALMILNIKSERIEPRVLESIRAAGVRDYFFLDSSFTMIRWLISRGVPSMSVSATCTTAAASEITSAFTAARCACCRFANEDCFTG